MQEVTIAVDEGGKSQAISVSSTSAQSAAMPTGRCILYSTADVFTRQGTDPTALSDGTDQFIPAGVWLRANFARNAKLAFKTSGGSGMVYITPEI